MASLAEAFVQTLLPARCTRCCESLPFAGSRAGVCASCWREVVPHAGRPCPSCGVGEVDGEGPCLQCRTTTPPWRAAASFGPYRGVLRELVLDLKHRRRDELAAPLAGLLEQAWRRVGWARPDLIVPVPMPWLRRLRRGFNHADLLARALARRLKSPSLGALRRHGLGRQVGRGRRERLALHVTTFRARTAVSGRIMLIDDVLTTGATAAACTRSLVAAGADEVFVLTLARTPNPGRIP